MMTNNRLRLLAALTLLAALLAGAPGHARAAGATICGTSGMNRAPLAQSTDSHQAGLVIDFGDGRVLTFCIDLGDDGQATGEELLRASNLPIIMEYSGNGGAVCKIDNVGSNFPSEPCFSHCTFQPGETCMYWVYSLLVGDHWQFSQKGASGVVVHSGDVNGWAWGESTVAHGAQPPLRTLAEICQAVTATPTPSITPTSSATPTPTMPPPATQPPAVAPPATTTPYVARVITATPTASATPTHMPIPTVTPAVASSAPTSTPAQAAAPTVLLSPIPSTPTLMPPPPTSTPGATDQPTPISTAPATDTHGGLAAPETANRGAEGSKRIQLPLIQLAGAATPSATTRATAQVATATATPASATPTPARPAAPDDDPTRTYPYFGGTAALLLAGWALLRRERRSP